MGDQQRQSDAHDGNPIGYADLTVGASEPGGILEVQGLQNRIESVANGSNQHGVPAASANQTGFVAAVYDEVSEDAVDSHTGEQRLPGTDGIEGAFASSFEPENTCIDDGDVTKQDDYDWIDSQHSNQLLSRYFRYICNRSSPRATTR